MLKLKGQTDTQNIIIGIDPGLASTGFGVIVIENDEEIPIDFGVIQTSKEKDLNIRLNEIYKHLKKLINKYKPSAIAIEDIYFCKNLKTAILVAQARGVALLSTAEMGIPVFEYSPLQVKQAIVGYGKATKEQVQKMIKSILKLEKIPGSDHAADSLAIALCHAHSIKRRMLFEDSGLSDLASFKRSGTRRRRRFTLIKK